MTDATPRDNATTGGFNPVVMAALLVVGLVATVVFFAGQAFDTGPRTDMDSRAHAASKSAVGYAAAVELLRKTGRPVVVARGATVADDAVLVITLDETVSDTVFDLPVVKNHSGPVLVVLPKWRTTIGERLNWVRKAGLRRPPADAWLKLPDEEGEAETPQDEEPRNASPQEAFREAMKAARPAAPDPTKVSVQQGADSRQTLNLAYGGQRTRIVESGLIERPQTFQYSPGWEPLIVDSADRPLMITAEAWDYYVLAEPDLMNTHGVGNLDNARAMIAMLDETFGPDASYVFDVSMYGLTRSRSFLRQVFEPPFVAATICAIAAVLLMGWHAFFGFGATARQGRAFAMGKRALADNQADLIKMTRREHKMGAPYGDLVRDSVARAVAAPRDLKPEALDELLDRMGEGGRTSWPLSTLRKDIEQAKDTAELVRAAERLHHWKLEMTRERQ